MDNKKQELINLLKELDIAMTDEEIEFYVGKLNDADFEKYYQYAVKLKSTFEDLKSEAMKKDPAKTTALLEEYEAEKKKNAVEFGEKVRRAEDKDDKIIDEYYESETGRLQEALDKLGNNE